MAASVPKRCPQCRSPVAERFPHAVMYDCGFSLFNNGQPVTDDYPAECQRRRIKRLEKQIAAVRAEAERWKQQYEALLDEIERLQREREEIADNVTRFALYDPDLNAWECQADDCRFWWEFEDGDPYDHDMRFCPRCGRRIVR